jgi:hypothetical protein
VRWPAAAHDDASMPLRNLPPCLADVRGLSFSPHRQQSPEMCRGKRAGVPRGAFLKGVGRVSERLSRPA